MRPPQLVPYRESRFDLHSSGQIFLTRNVFPNHTHPSPFRRQKHQFCVYWDISRLKSQLKNAFSPYGNAISFSSSWPCTSQPCGCEDGGVKGVLILPLSIRPSLVRLLVDRDPRALSWSTIEISPQFNMFRQIQSRKTTKNRVL